MMLPDAAAGRPRLVVTGATGLLGSALVREARHWGQVWGLARHPQAVARSCRALPVDLTDEASVAGALRALDADVVVHTAALTSVDLCETDPATASAVNVGGTRNILRALAGHHCRFIFISTDAVFDGARGHYAEDDRPAPLNVYGRTKLEAEEAVLAARPDALVIRTVFYGWNLLPKESLAEWMLSRLQSGDAVPGFVDVRLSPLFSDHLARLLLDLARSRAAGLLHLASSEGCSKYEFATRLAAAFGFPADRVIRAASESARLRAPRPKDLTLSVSRATAILGRSLPSVADGLRGFRDREPARNRSGRGEPADCGRIG